MLNRAGDGFPCAARNPLVMPKNAPLCRLRAEGPHAEISDFSSGSLLKFRKPIDLPGGHWAYFSQLICALQPGSAATGSLS